jgi:conflict system STAND superfamily ATPase/SIR2-like protein
VNPQVRNLANLMRLKRRTGEKYVLMLGAGASMSSGVKRTPDIMDELLAQYGQDLNGQGRVEDRFDRLWQRTPNATRRAFLQPYLDHQPSPGYGKLAALIDAGYFEVVVTFNFDDLVETSLKHAGFTDYGRIVRGETIDEEMQTLVDTAAPRCKIVKLHGSLTSSDHFLFDVNEMLEYPKPIADLVAKITSRDLIICGYSFNDVCVLRAFSPRGGPIVCVNPTGVPRGLRGFLKDRLSEDLGIDAKFDEFFDDLYDALLAQPTAPAAAPPQRNPFKFLESYEAGDKDGFAGRADEIARFRGALDARPQVIIVAGPAKAGKTSLVRAGVLPSIDSATYAPVYVRCQPELEKTLRAELWPGQAADPAGLPAVFSRLSTEAAGKRVVLFLDQFERSTARFDLETRAGRDELAAMCKQVLSGSVPVTLVPVIVDDNSLLTTLVQACAQSGVSFQIVQCAAFERDEVATIVKTLAAAAQLEFDQRIIDEMSAAYEQTKTASPEQRLTLAHVQAMCHILAATRTLDYESYRRAFDNNLNALHQAINVCDIIGFVEDLTWPNDVWFRNMIKVPLRESKERIAEFIKLHYDELVPQPERSRVPRPAWTVPAPGEPRAAGTV